MLDNTPEFEQEQTEYGSFTRKEIGTFLGKMEVFEAGDPYSDNVIVLAPGAFHSALTLLPVAEEVLQLNPDARILVVSWVDHNSQIPKEGSDEYEKIQRKMANPLSNLSYNNQAKAFWEAMGRLNVNSPINLIGHSMGAAVCARIIDQANPGTVKTFVGWGPVPSNIEGGLRMLVGIMKQKPRALPKIIIGALKGNLDPFKNIIMETGIPNATDEQIKEFLNLEGLLQWESMRALLDTLTTGVSPKLIRNKVRNVGIIGLEEDFVIPMSLVRWFATKLGVSPRMIQNAGHETGIATPHDAPLIAEQIQEIFLGHNPQLVEA